MSGIELLQRDFNMDDLQMLQRSQVFHNGFENDKADFEGAFPALGDPFAADFQTAIDTADAIPSGAEVISEIKYVTEQLDEKMPEARTLMQKLFTYADWAWESKAKTEQFGRQKYGKVGSNHERMKEVLEMGHRNAIKPANTTYLTAAGMPAGLPGEIETLMNEMDALIAEQQDLYSSQKMKSQTRIEAYNTVWGFMRKINQASKVVFESNPAKLEFYMLYPGSSTSLPKPQNLTAVLMAGQQDMAELNWDPVAGAEEYKVFWSEVAIGQPAGEYEETATVLEPPAIEIPAVPGRDNYYRVRAYGEGLESAYSDAVLLPG